MTQEIGLVSYVKAKQRAQIASKPKNTISVASVFGLNDFTDVLNRLPPSHRR